jgi:hypothetical protein
MKIRIKPIFGNIPDLPLERFAFVLMPYEDNLTTIYETIVKPVVRSRRLECRRADDYRTNKEVMKEIWNGICQSRVVIAEMTGFNPNVMYELGISHTVGKETIMMTQNLGKNQEFPFDMAHIRRIQYQDSSEGYPRLKEDLSRTLDFVLQQPETSENGESQYQSSQVADQIAKLKVEGTNTFYPEISLKSIDALAQYGEPAIDAILAIVSSTIRTDIREHGLGVITKIREKLNRTVKNLPF